MNETLRLALHGYVSMPTLTWPTCSLQERGAASLRTSRLGISVCMIHTHACLIIQTSRPPEKAAGVESQSFRCGRMRLPLSLHGHYSKVACNQRNTAMVNFELLGF